MRLRGSILLLLSNLLLFIFSSSVFPQTDKTAFIKKSILADSIESKAIKSQLARPPLQLHPSLIHLDTNAFSEAKRRGEIQLSPSNAQWVSFHLSSTQWDWCIRMPGTYAGRVLVGSIQSNGKVLLYFEGFGDLDNSHSSEYPLEIYYALADPVTPIEELRWMKPTELNAFGLGSDPTSIAPVTWTLWQKILVKEYTPASEFSDNAVISIQLPNNSPWMEIENFKQEVSDK